MFGWLEDRHPRLYSISFVDDIGLVIDREDLNQGTRHLERVARDAVQWLTDNKVEFEVSKTEVLLFSRRRKVLQAAKDASIQIGDLSFTIKQEATKWLGFWLDSKLSFKVHFENRMASAKGALQRVASLSRSNGGLSVRLMRRVVVAAVTSVAMYGSEVWWRGEKDRLGKLQLLWNSQGRAITGLMKSAPLAFLREAACLPSARNLHDYRQTRYAVRALSAAGDHPTHQLLPANFRFGELHRHEGAIGQPSSIGWTKPETHRSLGGRPAQQIVRNVRYDAEYGFELPCKVTSPVSVPVIRNHGYSDVPERILPDHPRQLTIFVGATKDVSYGVGAAWRERREWKTKASSLGKYMTKADAALFAIGMVVKGLLTVLHRANHCCAEVVTESRQGLAVIESAEHWALPIITGMNRPALRIEDAGG